MLSQRLWTSSGKAPAATVAAQLAVDIKRHPTGSRFERVAPSTYRLREQALSAAPTSPPTGGNRQAAGTMSFTDAAEAVLDAYAHEKPMHYREIVDRALANYWITTSGLTPEATSTPH